MNVGKRKCDLTADCEDYNFDYKLSLAIKSPNFIFYQLPNSRMDFFYWMVGIEE
jgi:hypothetical protein